MINYRFRLSPTFGTRESTLGQRSNTAPANWEDVKFLRSWLVADSDLETTRTTGRFNWNMIAGLAVTALVSAGGWAGIVLLVRYFVK